MNADDNKREPNILESQEKVLCRLLPINNGMQTCKIVHYNYNKNIFQDVCIGYVGVKLCNGMCKLSEKMNNSCKFSNAFKILGFVNLKNNFLLLLYDIYM